jgi:hypothetical protein
VPAVGIVIVLACEVITQDFDRIIAIQVDGGNSRQIMVGDSLLLTATAINAAGDSVPGAEIVWAVLEVDSGQVGFTLDPGGLAVGISEGQGNVQARVETLRSEPVLITVLPADTTTTPSIEHRLTKGHRKTNQPPPTIQDWF